MSELRNLEPWSFSLVLTTHRGVVRRTFITPGKINWLMKIWSKPHFRFLLRKAFFFLLLTDDLKIGQLFYNLFGDQLTCSNAYNKVSAGGWLPAPQPAGLDPVEAVEVDKVGAAQTTDDREPSSVGSKSAEAGAILLKSDSQLQSLSILILTVLLLSQCQPEWLV